MLAYFLPNILLFSVEMTAVQRHWEAIPELDSALREFRDGLRDASGSTLERAVKLMGVASVGTLNNFLSGKRPSGRTRPTDGFTVTKRLITALKGDQPFSYRNEDPPDDNERAYWAAHATRRTEITNWLQQGRNRALRTPVQDAAESTVENNRRQIAVANRGQDGNQAVAPAPRLLPVLQLSETSRVRGLGNIEASLEQGGNYAAAACNALLLKASFGRVSAEKDYIEEESYDIALGSCRVEIALPSDAAHDWSASFRPKLGELTVTARAVDRLRPYCELHQKANMHLAQMPLEANVLCEVPSSCQSLVVDLTFARGHLRLFDPNGNRVTHNGDGVDAIVYDWLIRKQLEEVDETNIYLLQRVAVKLGEQDV